MSLPASERLAASRERLRRALNPTANSPGQAASSSTSQATRAMTSSVLLSKLVGIFLDGNPLRATAIEGAGALHDWLKPAIQRNPWGMTASAVAIGAVAAKVLQQRSSRQRGKVSVNTWLMVLATLLAARKAPK